MSPHRRRGACPSLRQPMATGDGLLVRLAFIAPVPPDALAALCRLAGRHGNGVLEITRRGNIQLRGLREETAAALAVAVEALDLPLGHGLDITACPLDPTVAALADELRRRAAAASLAARLGPKVSVIIDGEGPFHLDALAADIRLRRAAGSGDVHVALGGDARAAVPLGRVAAGRAVETALGLLDAIAAAGRETRGRTLLMRDGACRLRAAMPGLSADGPAPALRAPAAVGRQGGAASAVLAVGLPFGQAGCDALHRLLVGLPDRVRVQPIPGNMILFCGLDDVSASKVELEAAALDFVVEPGDPRRFVTACVGAPGCASAELATRALASCLAEGLGRALGPDFSLHVSGCAKGCGRPATAKLAVTGRPDGLCAVEGGGRAAVVAPAELPGALARCDLSAKREFHA